MNLRDLARLTNYSVSTVSKAFHGADDISSEAKEVIFEAAKRYGCYEKYHKEKYDKKIIAIICPELRSYYYANFIDQLQKFIENHNGVVLISTDDFCNKKQAELLDYYISYLHVDGIFINEPRFSSLPNHSTPVVSLSGAASSRVDTIYYDLETPIRKAITHLHELGHRRIAFIGEELTDGKKRNFCRAAADLGLNIPEEFLFKSTYRFEKAGEDGVEQLFHSENCPTAVLCAYDYIAQGAISRLIRKGLRVPEDVSVIGMDNIKSSEHTTPELTTIDSGYEEICRIAWDLMCKKMNDRQYTLQQKITVTGELILRNTTAPAKETL